MHIEQDDIWTEDLNFLHTPSLLSLPENATLQMMSGGISTQLVAVKRSYIILSH